jgi:hypothetical protein
MAVYENEAAQESAQIESGEVDGGDDEDEKILKASRDGLKDRIDDESIERKKMEDDMRFVTLDQWPAEIRRARESDPNGARPCLTSDEMNQYIVQVENDMRHNRPSIKPRPVDDKGDPATAEIFAGLIRHIEDQSNASVAYVTGGGSAVRIGLGFFRVTTEYVSPDSFDQEPRIKRIPNTFGVYLGRHIQPDGSDADQGWIIEQMPLEQFKREFPNAKNAPADFEGLGVTPTWRSEDTVTVVEYFYIKYTAATLLFLADGSTVFSDEYDGPAENVVDKRPAHKQSVKWCKHTGAEVLEKRDWLGKYIPIIEVVGKESYVDGKRVLWGLVRPAKDMLRMKNYWLSAATEKIALSPKTPFIGAVGQFATDGESWKKANIENRAFLQYDPIDVNGNALPKPDRVAPAPVEMAIVNMLGMIEHDVQKSLGMFKASVGEAESQQSGKAILALQRESDTGTFHFQDNLSLSIQYCGRILIDLIPKVIDTRRVLRILGEDGKSRAVTVDPEAKGPVVESRDSLGNVKKIYNLGVGTYDVTVSTGPSYSTGRQEATAVFTELANSAKDPISANVLRYLAIKNSDFHASDEATRMLGALLPPQVQPADGDDAPVPPQAMAKIAELTQQNQVMQQKGQELMQENQQLKSGAQEKMAKVAADAEQASKELMVQKQKQEAEAQLARQKAAADFDLKEYVAERQMKLDQEQADFERALKQNQFISDQNDKIAARNEATQSESVNAVVEVVPQVIGQLEQMFKQFGEFMQQQIVLQSQTLDAIKSSKSVSIGSIKRDANGTIIGANVSAAPTTSKGQTVQ